MALVRISLLKGRPDGFGKKVGEVVYRAMIDTINVPAKDHFQIITEHDREHLVYDADYLGIQRTDALIFIQITLNEGRTVELKKAFYRAVASRLKKNSLSEGKMYSSISSKSRKKTGHSATGLPSMLNNRSKTSYRALLQSTFDPVGQACRHR